MSAYSPTIAGLWHQLIADWAALNADPYVLLAAKTRAHGCAQPVLPPR